jgi:hypothetical protein
MKIGIHQGVAEAVYRAAEGVSQSDLKPLLTCPAKAREAQLHPSEQTDSQALGQATHFAVFQPELFEEEYVVRPAGMERRSNAGKAAWAAFEKAHEAKQVISQEDWDLCLAIRDSVWGHPTAQAILASRRMVEASAWWEDPETGLLCKGRMDAICAFDGETLVPDLKTTRDASPEAFGRDAARYGYHFQGAHYLGGLNVLAPRERRWVLIAVEKAPPYLVAVYEFDWESLEAGRRDVRRALALWEQCSESGIWPGYPSEIQTLELPRWALSRADEEIL